MATFVGISDQEARAQLSRAGVMILREDDPQLDLVMCATLDEDSRFDRDLITAEPPASGAEYTGFGAWHRNNHHEFHSVVSGSGIVEFMTESGPVAALIGPGDVMVVLCAEHRYLPLTRQEWVVRFGGGPGSELVPTDTDRPAGPWPTRA